MACFGIAVTIRLLGIALTTDARVFRLLMSPVVERVWGRRCVAAWVKCAGVSRRGLTHISTGFFGIPAGFFGS